MIQIASVVLMILGIFSLLTTRHIIKMIVGLNLFEIGLNVFIITVGFNRSGVAPILTEQNASSSMVFVDPLPQAIVLTAIVIGFGITAVALALAKKIYGQYGTYDIDEIGGRLI